MTGSSETFDQVATHEEMEKEKMKQSLNDNANEYRSDESDENAHGNGNEIRLEDVARSFGLKPSPSDLKNLDSFVATFIVKRRGQAGLPSMEQRKGPFGTTYEARRYTTDHLQIVKKAIYQFKKRTGFCSDSDDTSSCDSVY